MQKHQSRNICFVIYIINDSQSSIRQIFTHFRFDMRFMWWQVESQYFTHNFWSNRKKKSTRSNPQTPSLLIRPSMDAFPRYWSGGRDTVVGHGATRVLHMEVEFLLIWAQIGELWTFLSKNSKKKNGLAPFRPKFYVRPLTGPFMVQFFYPRIDILMKTSPRRPLHPMQV